MKPEIPIFSIFPNQERIMTPPPPEKERKVVGFYQKFLDKFTKEKFDIRKKNYEFFVSQDERDELVYHCAELATYLHDEGIPNLVIMDRSSRPLYVGLTEYWKKKFPQEPMPKIYFMNPKGFNSRENTHPLDAQIIAVEAFYKGDAPEHPDQMRSQYEIDNELKERYSQLMKDKDKPLLIFDSCIHTGNTLFPIKDALQYQGFTDLRVGSINPSDNESIVETDFAITEHTPIKGCYPFDRDQMIEKTFDSVFSKVNPNPQQRAAGRRLREEIRQIMQDSLKNKK